MAERSLGFVGIGRMGGPMASRLLDAGHSLCVCDIDPDALPCVHHRFPRGAAPAPSTTCGSPAAEDDVQSGGTLTMSSKGVASVAGCNGAAPWRGRTHSS